MTRNRKYFKGNYFETNLVFGLIGVGIGLLISVFESAFNDSLIPFRYFASNLLFSTIITLCITNSIYLFVCFRRTKRVPLWLFLIIYYICNLLGMLAGIELSYLAIYFIFHVPYTFLHHYSDYRFNILIVLVVSTIIYFYLAQKAEQEAKLREKELDLIKIKQLKTQAELQTLQSKINPHFLYNALNSIASLIREDADKAEDMTLKLSRLFRYSINSPQENIASVTEEMEIVNTYLGIEKIRFGDRLSFLTQVDESVMEANIPRFLIQPLVENALKHGLNDMADKGELSISINTEGQNILIIIADNGKPFPDELNIGYGLQSTYDKLTLLYGDNYQLHIANVPQKQIKIMIPAAI